RPPRRRPRPRANLVAARALRARRRTPTQCPCDFPRDGEKDLPQWDCDKHYRYKRKGRFSQDAAARTLDGGQVRSHKITPTRLGLCLFCRGLSLSVSQKYPAPSPRSWIAMGAALPWRTSIAPSAKNIRLQKNDVLFANRTSISLRPCSI